MNKVLCVLIIGLGMCISAQAADRELVCKYNPQACEAMARNDRIRADVNSRRCVQLYNAIKTMREPARSYQMRKLRASGC